jgi:hypothetical protein
MYVILDKSLLEKQLISRFHAEQELERLQSLPRIEGDAIADYAIFMQVCNMDPNALENLYALAALMLESAKLNPLKAMIKFPTLDGNYAEVSVASVMNTARMFLDQTEVNA